jgi:hypothetical protein
LAVEIVDRDPKKRNPRGGRGGAVMKRGKEEEETEDFDNWWQEIVSVWQVSSNQRGMSRTVELVTEWQLRHRKDRKDQKINEMRVASACF